MIARIRFIGRSAYHGIQALVSYRGAFVSAIGLAAIAGLSVPDHVAPSVPSWVKAAVLVGIVVFALIEGAYLEYRDVTRLPQPPPVAQNVTHIYGGNHYYGALPNSGALENVHLPGGPAVLPARPSGDDPGV